MLRYVKSTRLLSSCVCEKLFFALGPRGAPCFGLTCPTPGPPGLLLQPMWSSVEDLSPDVWLWIGDAVYVDKFSDGGVKKVRYPWQLRIFSRCDFYFFNVLPSPLCGEAACGVSAFVFVFISIFLLCLLRLPNCGPIRRR